MNYLQIENLSKSFGDLVLFEDINFSIDKGQRVALIAKNGTGKTSLLKIIGGKDSADSGRVVMRNGINLGYLEQVPPLNDERTIMQEVFQSGSEMVTAISDYEQACVSGNAEDLDKASQSMDRLDAWDYEVKIKQILAQLKITDLDKKIEHLSGGQKKRLALANVLINQPDIIVLDEPTNHLDLDMIEWLEGFLINSTSTLIMVTHDRYFLDRICNVIYELDNQEMYRYKGNYSYFLEKREERILNQSSEIEKARALFKKERDWMNRMPSARSTKAKYRIDSFYETKEAANKKINTDKVQIEVHSARLGKKIIEIYNIYKRFDKTIILEDFTYNFKRFEKIGIVGENGTGKTTLLNLLTGELPVDKGTIEIGSTVVFGYYKQDSVHFDETKTVIEIITEIAEDIKVGEGKSMSPLQFLNYFLFPPNMHLTLVSKLSGGEKRRLHLMTVLMKNPNFLILDEPTNDLDLVTLNVLEDYLLHFQGCVLIVSHDRYFMDKIVDHMFVFEGKGKVRDFPGNYSQYRDWQSKQLAETKTKVIKTEAVAKKSNKDAPKTKLSFKEKQEFDALEKDLEKLNSEKESIEDGLNGGKLLGDEIIEAAKRLNEISELLDEKELRWLELSEYF